MIDDCPMAGRLVAIKSLDVGVVTERFSFWT